MMQMIGAIMKSVIINVTTIVIAIAIPENDPLSSVVEQNMYLIHFLNKHKKK